MSDCEHSYANSAGCPECGEEFASYEDLEKALAALVLFSKPDKSNSVALANAHRILRSAKSPAATAKEQLASQLISQLSLVRGRPVEWAEAIEITATITGMPDEEKQRLLAME